ncbi:MAG TPA: TlyA family RNA methyltransferase [Candidatus Dormibacteraeota bacterium]|nr:TlyA family RNA methyltransferase [Candidatus Dormibacteraeota bacterium]
MTTLQRARLDAVLVERGMAGSRERAQALVAAGLVEVDGVRARSAGVAVAAQAAIRLTDRTHPWAGRGGLKLDAALEGWRIECAGRTCLDAGASTGGFTDVLLHRDAALVYAVDVGHGQLHPRLAADPRVRILDRTNIRTLDHLDGPMPSLITLDLSFISLRAVLPGLRRFAPGADVVALFKPQFELPREAVGRGGVVRDPAATASALAELADWAGRVGVGTVLDEPLAAGVRGAKGNQEWLVHLRLAGPQR